VLALAVRDGRLGRNPADRTALPREPLSERRYLSHAKVRALASACAAPTDSAAERREARGDRRADFELAVLVLAYTGMRFGELAARREERRSPNASRRCVRVGHVSERPIGPGLTQGPPATTGRSADLYREPSGGAPRGLGQRAAGVHLTDRRAATGVELPAGGRTSCVQSVSKPGCRRSLRSSPKRRRRAIIGPR
jgi:hypothetical protein